MTGQGAEKTHSENVTLIVKPEAEPKILYESPPEDNPIGHGEYLRIRIVGRDTVKQGSKSMYMIYIQLVDSSAKQIDYANYEYIYSGRVFLACNRRNGPDLYDATLHEYWATGILSSGEWHSIYPPLDWDKKELGKTFTKLIFGAMFVGFRGLSDALNFAFDALEIALPEPEETSVFVNLNDYTVFILPFTAPNRLGSRYEGNKPTGIFMAFPLSFYTTGPQRIDLMIQVGMSATCPSLTLSKIVTREFAFYVTATPSLKIETSLGSANVQVASNSTVEAVEHLKDENRLRLVVSGTTGSAGTANIVVSKELLAYWNASISEIQVCVDGTASPFGLYEELNCFILTLNYVHKSVREIDVYYVTDPLTVQVVGARGQPIPDQEVSLKWSDNRFFDHGKTDANGYITFPKVPNGNFKARIEYKRGFSSQQEITIPQQKETTIFLDVLLEVGGLPLSTTETLLLVAGVVASLALVMYILMFRRQKTLHQQGITKQES